MAFSCHWGLCPRDSGRSVGVECRCASKGRGEKGGGLPRRCAFVRHCGKLLHVARAVQSHSQPPQSLLEARSVGGSNSWFSRPPTFCALDLELVEAEEENR